MTALGTPMSIFQVLGQATVVDSISTWEKYGFPGLVVLALFSIIMVAGKWALNHYTIESQGWMQTVDTIDERHRVERAEWKKEHAEERERWGERTDKTYTRLADNLATNTDTSLALHQAIRELVESQNLKLPGRPRKD